MQSLLSVSANLFAVIIFIGVVTFGRKVVPQKIFAFITFETADVKNAWRVVSMLIYLRKLEGSPRSTLVFL